MINILDYIHLHGKLLHQRYVVFATQNELDSILGPMVTITYSFDAEESCDATPYSPKND